MPLFYPANDYSRTRENNIGECAMYVALPRSEAVVIVSDRGARKDSVSMARLVGCEESRR